MFFLYFLFYYVLELKRNSSNITTIFHFYLIKNTNGRRLFWLLPLFSLSCLNVKKADCRKKSAVCGFLLYSEGHEKW